MCSVHTKKTKSLLTVAREQKTKGLNPEGKPTAAVLISAKSQ